MAPPSADEIRAKIESTESLSALLVLSHQAGHHGLREELQSALDAAITRLGFVRDDENMDGAETFNVTGRTVLVRDVERRFGRGRKLGKWGLTWAFRDGRGSKVFLRSYDSMKVLSIAATDHETAANFEGFIHWFVARDGRGLKQLDQL